MNKKCVVYTRVSSEKQVDGYSLDSQADLCTKRASQLGYEVANIFKEEGVSAKTTNRPELIKLLSYCKDKKNNISAVFVYSLSRLNRNTGNHIAIQALLAKSGVSIISLTEQIDDSPTGVFVTTMFAAMGQMENELRAVNVTNSLKRRFLEGNITSYPPLGYKMVKHNGKSTAQIDPRSFYALRELSLKVAHEGWTLSDVAKELDKRGIKYITRSKKVKVTAKSLSKTLSNKFYIGTLVSQKYGEVEGKHTPMFTEDEYYEIKSALSGRKPHSKKRSLLREDFKLRQIVRCIDCNKFLTSSWSQGRSKKYSQYYCTSRGVHPIKSFNGDRMEKEFLLLLNKVSYDEDYLKWFVEFAKEKYHTQYDSINNSFKQVQKDVEDLKAAKKMAQKKNISGLYSDEEYKDLRDEYDTEIEVKMGILAEKKLLRTDIDIVLEFMVYYLSNLDRVWLDSTPEGRVAITGSIFPSGVVYNGKSFSNHSLGHGYKLIVDISNDIVSGEPERIRTSNQYLKRVLLYR